ncbi:MAG: TolC family protein [Bacteroidota bacterium]
MSSGLFNKHTILKGILMTFLSICLIGTDAKGQELEQFIKEGVLNNSALKAKYKAFEAALTRVSQEGTLPDPNLSFGYFVSPVETRVGPMQARFSLNQMFPWFGTLKKKKTVSALLAESKFQEFLQAKHSLIAEIKKGYYQIYETRSQLTLLQDELQIFDVYKSLVTTSFSAGNGTLTDIIQIDLQREEIKISISVLEDQLSLQTTQFSLLIEEEKGEIVPVELTIPAIDPVFLDIDSVENNPYLKAIDQQMLAMKEKQQLTVLNSYPKIGLGLDYTMIGEGPDPNVSNSGRNALMPMVTMSLPIFRSKYKSAITEINLKTDELALKKQAYANSLMADYSGMKFEMEKARKRSQLFEEQINRISEVIELLYTAYSNSGKDFDEVLKAKQQQLRYRMEKVTIIKQYFTAQAAVELITAKGTEK